MLDMATITEFINLFKSEISNKTDKGSIAPLNFDNVFTKLSEVLTTINTQGGTNKKNVSDLSASTIALSSSILAICDVTDYTVSQGVKVFYCWKPGAENVYYTAQISESGKLEYEGLDEDVWSLNGEIIFDGLEKGVILTYKNGRGEEYADVKIDKESAGRINEITPRFDMKGNLYKINFADCRIISIIRQNS